MRVDIQVTEEQSIVVAKALADILPGFTEQYEKLINDGSSEPDKHMAIVYRSREVQNAMDADEPGAPT